MKSCNGVYYRPYSQQVFFFLTIKSSNIITFEDFNFRIYWISKTVPANMDTLDVVDLISKLLDSGKYSDALKVPNEPKLQEKFKDNCWDLIAVIIGKIQNDTITLKPSLYGACEQLLQITVQISVPEEALLEYIEQIELAKNDAQFGIILPPLQDLLKKLLNKGRSLEWCLNSISNYIEEIPIPEHNLEGKQRVLMDSDPNIRRITRVYTLLPPFYEPFIKEPSFLQDKIRNKQIITAFLISLLGKPLIYIDLDPESNDKSEARSSCLTILQDICTLERNVLKFLAQLEKCSKVNTKKSYKDNNNDDEKYPYEQREKINMTTLSGLFYVIFSDNFCVPDSAIPQVYCVDYVLHTVMLSVIHLLSFSEYGPLAKGLSLWKSLLNRFPGQLTSDILSSSVHFEVCRSLVNIAIYSSYETIRKQSVNLIGCHVNKFDYRGRYMLIKYLIDISNHSGMIGFAITLFKNSIDEAFKDPVLDECFRGAQFSNMIKKICHLPHGTESDLVELADQIITSLNFLRYLAIKDVRNETGIKDCFSMIDNEYLDKLRMGLNMSKAHYEAKLQSIEEGKKLPEENVEVSLNVGGNILDQIPLENKKEIICSALNAFHLMEGLVARLSECININKLQGLKMDCD